MRLASNAASNTESASNNEYPDGIIRSSAGTHVEGVRVAVVGRGAGGGGCGDTPISRKQRWSREQYNAYMRDYMKRRRSDASGEKSRRIIKDDAERFSSSLKRLADK
jgi:hypothetical protein